MNRVAIEPRMLEWARDRAGCTIAELEQRFPRLPQWKRGEKLPTLKQVEAFAKKTYTPVGYLFLKKPPDERVPIPDFRTMENQHVRPSPNLLDTIYVCQQRQEWYRDYAKSIGEQPLAFVGSASIGRNIKAVAADIRRTLNFDIEQRSRMPTWRDALRHFIDQADQMGVMVMCNGVVHNNNHRHLDPQEFRGFAIADDLAPLVFINGADTKAAQMFTLAHELAHIWLGKTGLSDAQPLRVPNQATERWCNEVAAELLVPLDVMRQKYNQAAELQVELGRLARCFKVSTLVILRRIHDAGHLTQDALWTEYHAELERLLAIPRGTGGNFYLTQAARVSKRFASAVISSVLEGRGSFTESFRMLGIKKMETFQELAHSLGVM